MVRCLFLRSLADFESFLKNFSILLKFTKDSFDAIQPTTICKYGRAEMFLLDAFADEILDVDVISKRLSIDNKQIMIHFWVIQNFPNCGKII